MGTLEIDPPVFGVFVIDDTADFPDIAPSGMEKSISPHFSIQLDENAKLCGNFIDFVLGVRFNADYQIVSVVPNGDIAHIHPRIWCVDVQIFALQFIEIVPDAIPVTSGRIYRIEGIIPEISIDAWRKSPLSSDESRNIPFAITGDDGERQVIVICLDDPDVLFFSRDDIENLLL